MFLKNKNIIFKIRRSKVTDYAALKIKILKLNNQSAGLAFDLFASLPFYIFSSTRLINSIQHEHTCEVLYVISFSIGPFRQNISAYDYSYFMPVCSIVKTLSTVPRGNSLTIL